VTDTERQTDLGLYLEPKRRYVVVGKNTDIQMIDHIYACIDAVDACNAGYMCIKQKKAARSSCLNSCINVKLVD